MSGSSSDVLGFNGVPIKRQRRPLPPPPGQQGSDGDDTSSSDAAWPPPPMASDELAVAEPSPPATTKHWLKKKEEAEKQLQEKSAAYPYLWREVEEVAVEITHIQPLAVLKAAFLKLDDAKAAQLNALAKKQQLAELRLSAKQQGIQSEVAAALIDLVN